MKKDSGILAATKGLLTLIGPRLYGLIFLAIINGTLSEMAGIGTLLFGALGIASGLGLAVSLAPGWLMALALISGLLRGVLRYGEQYLNHYIAFTLLAQVRQKTYTALADLAPAKLEGEKKGNIIALVTADTEALEIFYAHTISPIFIGLNTLIIVTLILGFLSSWLLAINYVVFYLIIGLLIPQLAFIWQTPIAQQYRAAAGNFSAHYLDALKGAPAIVFARNETVKTAEIVKESDRLSTLNKRLKWRGAVIDNLTILLWGGATMVALYLGLSLLGAGATVLGVALTMASFRPALALSNLPMALTSSYAAARRILKLLAEEPVVKENKAGKVLAKLTKVEVAQVGFSYQGTDQPVLTAINLSLPTKGVVALTGDSGAGKSTLLKLLLRHHDPATGEIAYNGIPLKDIKTASLRQSIALMDQQTYLFHESIAANLREAKPQASEAQLWAALKKAAAFTYVENLPEGLETIIDPDGDNISSGERQRLGLARLFLREPDLILLDEPTSNVDSLNEKLMLDAIVKQSEKTGILLVSHRQSTLKAARDVYHLTAGQLGQK